MFRGPLFGDYLIYKSKPIQVDYSVERASLGIWAGITKICLLFSPLHLVGLFIPHSTQELNMISSSTPLATKYFTDWQCFNSRPIICAVPLIKSTFNRN